MITQKPFGRAAREVGVISEHGFGPLLLDASYCSGFLAENFI